MSSKKRNDIYLILLAEEELFMTAASFSPLEVCYCSDPADFAFCQSLDLHLAPLKRNGRIQTWNGQQILPGQDWKQEYEQHLSTAPLLLLLISPDFLASEMGQYQMNIALCRHQSRDAVVIPILVRPCGWQETELSFLQILPREQKALSSWPDLDEAWQEIVADISCVIETIRKWVFVAYASEVLILMVNSS
jgi:TIR domain